MASEKELREPENFGSPEGRFMQLSEVIFRQDEGWEKVLSCTFMFQARKIVVPERNHLDVPKATIMAGNLGVATVGPRSRAEIASLMLRSFPEQLLYVYFGSESGAEKGSASVVVAACCTRLYPSRVRR